MILAQLQLPTIQDVHVQKSLAAVASSQALQCIVYPFDLLEGRQLTLFQQDRQDAGNTFDIVLALIPFKSLFSRRIRFVIDVQDLELIQVIDEPANVVDAIFSYYESRDIVPAEIENPPHSFL